MANRRSTPPETDIAAARDGDLCTFAGTVRRVHDDLLTSPLSQRARVYWEVNRAVGDQEPERFEARDFWLEDATGRVLVRARSVRVDARAERRRQAIAIVDADIHDVSGRLRQLKKDRKSASGKQASKMAAEQKRLKKLATLLCAIGAHARGNVHVGGSLDRQEAYIRERSKQFEQAGEGGRALGLLGERYEVALVEGTRIQVVGLCEHGPAPAGVGHGGSYRQAPTCLQVRAPDGGELIVRGLGDDAPAWTETAPGSQVPLAIRNRGGGNMSRLVRVGLTLVLAIATAVVWWVLRG